MTQYRDADEILAGGRGAPVMKFASIGDEIKGIVLEKASAQVRDFATGEPKTYQDGNPVMQIIITLQTELRDPTIDGDDGQRRVFAKGQLITAIRDAVKEAKADRLEVGANLAIRYTGNGESKTKGFQPPKQFRAWVRPGVKLDDDSAPF